MGEDQSTASSQRPASISPYTISPRIHPGLALLYDAYNYARELRRDPWDFAVEIRSLEGSGLTRSDIRWLVCKGFIRHAHEVQPAGGDERRFRSEPPLTFSKRTCFVLTEPGSRFALRLQQELRAAADAHLTTRNGHAVVPANGQMNGWLPSFSLLRSQTPTWDGERHELRVAGQLVKIFKLPSPNQETVLMAFEEEGWPPRIDDPLSPAPEIDPKRRLHDTLKSLNRNQKNRLIRFMGDGTGEGIRWELIPAT